MTVHNKKKILINCSNLHNGGGVAVASSFIDCLSCMRYEEVDIHLLVSSSVDKNLESLKTEKSVFKRYIIKDYLGLDAIWKGLDHQFRNIDLVFTVFGPAYFLFPRSRHIFGFAQPNIIYPNPFYYRLGIIDKLMSNIKFKLQEWFFSRADSLIVELEHVQKGLEKKKLFQGKPINVVYSAVHSVFREPAKWSPLTLPMGQGGLRLGIISRNYPHKNLSCLPDVKKVLREKYGLCVNFFVTFQHEEWSKCDKQFKEAVINVGPLALSQCPTFYSSMDGVIFPSLLECFSAVPIEAMMSKKPLFASDLPFIRDCCGDHCNYFDPMDVNDISRVIVDYFSNSLDYKEEFVGSAYDFVSRYPGPRDRARSYMSIMLDTIGIGHT